MSDLTSYWAAKKKKLQESKESGLVNITYQGSRMQVSVPANEEFIRGAKKLNGRYRYRTQVWSFAAVSRDYVLELISDCYGLAAIQEGKE